MTCLLLSLLPSIRSDLSHFRSIPLPDPDPDSKHMGETREERIVQFLEDNDTPVVGLREGAMLREENGTTTLRFHWRAHIPSRT